MISKVNSMKINQLTSTLKDIAKFNKDVGKFSNTSRNIKKLI